MILAAHGVQTPPRLPIPALRGRRVLLRPVHSRAVPSRSSRPRAAGGRGFSVLEERHLFAWHGAVQRRPGERDHRPGWLFFSLSCPRRHGATPVSRGAHAAPAARAWGLCFARANMRGNAAHEHREAGLAPRDGRDDRERPVALCAGLQPAQAGLEPEVGVRQPRVKKAEGTTPTGAAEVVTAGRDRHLHVVVEPPAGKPANQANVHGARPECTNGGAPHDEHPSGGVPKELLTAGKDRRFLRGGDRG